MRSKRYKKLPEKTNELQADLIENVLSTVKSNCTTKFDESVDLSLQINQDYRVEFSLLPLSDGLLFIRKK